MNKMFLILLTVIPLSAAGKNYPAGEDLFLDLHRKSATRLTFERDNGESYFSRDESCRRSL